MRYALIAVLLLSGCAIYAPRNIDEQIRSVREAGGTGCVYFRGNSRPYADVSVLMVSTIGQGTNYKECLEVVPEGARSLVQPQ
jgi:hypothetical protein